MNKRDVIHVVVDDEYDIDEDDLRSLTKMFLNAQAKPEGGVVVTPYGIRARIISIEEGLDTRIITAEVPGHIIEEVIELNHGDE